MTGPYHLICVPDVTQTNPDGVDFGWVMQVTFVTTILIGVPVVAGASLLAPGLETWNARATFAIRIGALVWLAVSLLTYSYARLQQA